MGEGTENGGPALRKQIAVYGSGGVGKTSFLETVGSYYHANGGFKTLVVSLDPGGAGPLDEAVEAGFVKLLQVGPTQYPLRMLDYLSQGYIPENPAEPKKFLKVDFQKEGYRAFCIEGLTAASTRIMNWARDKQAKGEQIGQMDGGKVGMFQDGPEGDQVKYGVNTMTHYGVAQSYMETFVHKMSGLWGQGVETILWTALELKSTDDDKSTPVYGPKLAGKAATGICIPWFTDVWHLDAITDSKAPKPTDGVITGERKLFLSRHYAPGDPIPYLAKTSVNPKGKMPGVIAPDFGVFMKELEAAKKRISATWTTKDAA